MAKEGGEIRIVKRKKAHHGHHGGAWKVAYADFVTAMMAFFMVMWLIGMSPETRSAIAAYFRDPVGFMEAVQKSKAMFSISNELPPGAKNTANMPTDKGDQDTEGKQKKILKDRKTERAEMEALKKYLEAAITNIPDLARLREHVKIEFVKEGLRIELIEGPEPVFFRLGSAEITPPARKLLSLIAREIGKLDNRIILEGHTDSQPYRYGGGYSNWELSADRANAARRVMEAGGLWKGQVAEVRGYADTRLRTPSDPFHYSNRRVSLLIPYQSRETAETN
ncbi:MAG: flagellar motor protein MotB [Fimbriimonadales bacterium]